MSASEQTAKARQIADTAPAVRLPANVVEALRAVSADLPAIGKDQKAAAQQGGYSYRGIDQITGHCQRLFAAHGVVFVPRVVAWEIREIVVNGKPWTDTVELVEFDVYGPGGVEDRITVGPILAIGRDNSDKGANKCLTQAYKYALLQTLTISDGSADGDGVSHEADAVPVVWNAGMVKAALVEILGSTDHAREAWELGDGDSLTVWSRGVAVRLAEEWVNQPPDEAVS